MRAILSLQCRARSPQRALLPAHVRPEIADGGDAIRHRPQRERPRADLAALDLLPRAGRGHGRARPRAHGVGGGEGGAVAVAAGVDVDAAAAVRLGELLGQVLRDRAGRGPRPSRARTTRPRRSPPCRRGGRRCGTPSSPTSSPSSADRAPRAGRALRAPPRAGRPASRPRTDRDRRRRMSGWKRSGTRDGHTCGVMQFWLASQSSDRSSDTSG